MKQPFLLRGLKDMEQDSSSMEKRFSFKFLKRLLKYIDSAQEFIAHLGECVTDILKHRHVKHYEDLNID